jgi:hypothetical protein
MPLPAGTLEKLASPHPEGTRHQAKLELAMELLGNGIPESAVEITLLEKFPQAAPKEILDVIRWALSHSPGPSAMPGQGFTPNLRNGFFHRDPAFRKFVPPQAKPKPNAAARALQGWLNGRLVTEEDLYAASPVKPDQTDFKHNAQLLMESLYSECDCLNIVCAHTINPHGKANPQGSGKCLSCINWCRWFHEKGVPQTRAGAWLRPNPVRQEGSGTNGAFMDADVVAPRFLLLESDCLPLDLQLSAIASFRLPVAAVLTSGGSSYHAWLHINAHDLDEYAESATRILGAASKFGFDAANKNPSRLSRLPGAVREVKAQGDGKQRLIYLNPDPKWRPIL